jgi:tetratricopeptide (TPR) repeat protein
VDRDRQQGNEPQSHAGSPAVSIALDAARENSSIAEDARVYLREQTEFVRLQAEQLREEGKLSLRLRHAGEVLKFAFELSVALVLVGIVIALGAAVWTAAHDNGLVIEAFSVPPDLAARGLSGEVVASHLLDKLTRMQDETNSIRPADTYRNNWGDDIKVEIPDTGISIGELYRYLRHWLGHETHITGEVYRTPTGIAVTARAGAAGTTFTGKESDLDALLQKAAEQVYAQTQPYRYAAYLDDQNKIAESMRMLEAYAPSAPPAERAWAYSLLGNLDEFFGREKEAMATLRIAVAADPDNAHVWDNLANQEQTLNHVEDAYRHTLKALSLYDTGSAALNPDRVKLIKLQDKGFVASALGDYQTAFKMDEATRQEPDRGGSQAQALGDEPVELALSHDLLRARDVLAQVHPSNANQRLNLLFNGGVVAFLGRDWESLSRTFDMQSMLRGTPATFAEIIRRVSTRIPRSLLAEASAEQGDIAGARRMIATTPLDCYDCVRLRGRVDEVGRDWGGAAYWYGLAVRQAPSIPTAFDNWGGMLLAKGDAAGAIAKFQSAVARGPRFADPLEGWGEALMRENQSDLALAKFEAANAFAPNWGRLHLKWGEALDFAGRAGEAKAQYATASSLWLSDEERQELGAREAH